MVVFQHRQADQFAMSSEYFQHPGIVFVKGDDRDADRQRVRRRLLQMAAHHRGKTEIRVRLVHAPAEKVMFNPQF